MKKIKSILFLKKNSCLLFFSFFSFNLISQNLVINPSFENFTLCPLGPGNFNSYVQTWVNAYSTNACSSPDYYNGCNTNTFAGVPINALGNQNAATGVAYAGIMLFEASFQTPCLPPNGKNYREYIMGSLSAPLVAGQIYSVSFSINLPEDVMYATSDIGIYLSAANPIAPCPTPTPPVIPPTVLSYTPQLNYTGPPVANTTGWTQLQWLYTATGGEQYFIIGNFKNDANTTGVCTNPSAPMAFAYYFIDDVKIDTLASSSTLTVTSTSTNLMCNNQCSGTATANPIGTAPYSYNWNTNPVQTTQTAIGLCSGTYTVMVTDAANLTATSVVTITQPPALVVSVTSTTPSLCTSNNGSVTIAANGGTPSYSYSWSPGGATTTTINNLSPGIYTATVTDANGCTQTITATINQQSTLTSSATSTPSSCIGNTGTATVSAANGTPAYTYSWSPSGGTNAMATNLSPGTYTVNVTDANGCTSVSIVSVGLIPGPSASVSSDTVIQVGNSALLNATGGSNYNWFPSTGLSCTNCFNPIANPSETMIYCVEVVDSIGCKDTACVTVFVELPCTNTETLNVPNAFSPNNDGINDEFCLHGWDSCLEDLKIFIYNRWGEKVFESKDPNFCWDGKYNNVIFDTQVFVYYIKAKFIHQNKTLIKRGNISLIK